MARKVRANRGSLPVRGDAALAEAPKMAYKPPMPGDQVAVYVKGREGVFKTSVTVTADRHVPKPVLAKGERVLQHAFGAAMEDAADKRHGLKQ